MNIEIGNKSKVLLTRLLSQHVNKQHILRYSTTNKKPIPSYKSKTFLNNNNNNHNNENNKRYFRSTSPILSEKRDLYEVLGVSRDASKQDIKKAFYAVSI